MLLKNYDLLSNPWFLRWYVRASSIFLLWMQTLLNWWQKESPVIVISLLKYKSWLKWCHLKMSQASSYVESSSSTVVYSSVSLMIGMNLSKNCLSTRIAFSKNYNQRNRQCYFALLKANWNRYSCSIMSVKSEASSSELGLASFSLARSSCGRENFPLFLAAWAPSSARGSVTSWTLQKNEISSPKMSSSTSTPPTALFRDGTCLLKEPRAIAASPVYRV